MLLITVLPMESAMTRNHELDERILLAAKQEFLEKGFRDSSLRRIAERAGLTTGALYTRYAGKDELFASVVQVIPDAVEVAFSGLRGEYESAWESTSALERAMELESGKLLEILFEHYDEARLILCKSEGSTAAGFFDDVISRKVQETSAFFSMTEDDAIQRVLALLLSMQFGAYREIMRADVSEQEAETSMVFALDFMKAGWRELLPKLMKGEQD